MDLCSLSDDYNNPNWNCPCATYPGPPPPDFVGSHYYCESGDVGTYEVAPYFLSDPLWDGAGCGNGRCTQIGMSWSYRKLPVCVAENFEVRICKNDDHDNEDIAVEQVEQVELYVL